MLSLSAFNLDELAEAQVWKPTGQYLWSLSCDLEDLPEGFPDSFCDRFDHEAQITRSFRDMLGKLAGHNERGYVISAEEQDAAIEQPWLDFLLHNGIVCHPAPGNSAYLFTAKGKAALLAAQQLVNPVPVLSRRPDLAKHDMWETYSLMATNGWTLSKPQACRRPIAFQHGQPLLWYTRGKENETVHRSYLKCLLSEAEAKRRPVEHFRSLAYYDAWLEGREFQPKPRAITWQSARHQPLVNATDFTDDEAIEPVNPKQRRGRAKAVHPRARRLAIKDNSDNVDTDDGSMLSEVTDQSVTFEGSEEEEKLQPSCASRSPSCSNDSGGPGAGGSDGSAVEDGSDGSVDVSMCCPSDSSIGSDITELSSLDLSGSSSRKRRRTADIPEVHGPRLVGRSLHYNCFTLTPKGNPITGYTAWCHCKAHYFPDRKSDCNRGATFPANDEEAHDHCLRYLKFWCFRANEFTSRKAHQEKVSHTWPARSELPSSEELDFLLENTYSEDDRH